METNKELENNFNKFFTETETKPISNEIPWGTPKPKKTIMSEEEFDAIFGDILNEYKQ